VPVANNNLSSLNGLFKTVYGKYDGRCYNCLGGLSEHVRGNVITLKNCDLCHGTTVLPPMFSMPIESITTTTGNTTITYWK
jgi:hypothetical protein